MKKLLIPEKTIPATEDKVVGLNLILDQKDGLRAVVMLASGEQIDSLLTPAELIKVELIISRLVGDELPAVTVEDVAAPVAEEPIV